MPFVLAALAALGLAWPSVASAQYRNQQLGFEAGYQFIEGDFGLAEHAPIVGFRAGYKASDHWWFTARAMISWRGDNEVQGPGGERVSALDNTVVLFHLTPVDFRYYFLTDSVRPYLGGATAFHILANTQLPSWIQWGFGPVGGIELKLRRDLFLGFQADFLYLIGFGAEENPEVVDVTTQLIFFL